MNESRHDSLTEYGAHLLAEKIRRFWLDQGHYIKVWVEPVSTRHIQAFCVRSELVRGLPILPQYQKMAA